MDQRFKSSVYLVLGLDLKDLFVLVEDLLAEFLLAVDSSSALNNAKVLKEFDRELLHVPLGIEVVGLDQAFREDVKDRAPAVRELLQVELGLEKRRHAETAANVWQQALEKVRATVKDIHFGFLVSVAALFVEPVVLAEDSGLGSHFDEPCAESLAVFHEGFDLVAHCPTASATLNCGMVAKSLDVSDFELLLSEEGNHDGSTLGLGIFLATGATVVLFSLQRSPLVDAHEAGRGGLILAPGPEVVFIVAGPGSAAVDGEESEGPLNSCAGNGFEDPQSGLFLGREGDEFEKLVVLFLLEAENG